MTSACGSGRGGGHHGDRGSGRGLCRVINIVTVPVKLGRSPRVVYLAPCCPSPSPRTIQDTRPSPPTPLNLLPTCLPPRALPLQVRRSPLHLSPRRPSFPSIPPPRSPRRQCALPLSSALAPSPGPVLSRSHRPSEPRVCLLICFVSSCPTRIVCHTYLGSWFAPRLVFLHLFLWLRVPNVLSSANLVPPLSVLLRVSQPVLPPPSEL